jgi:hypothetical protein
MSSLDDIWKGRRAILFNFVHRPKIHVYMYNIIIEIFATGHRYFPIFAETVHLVMSLPSTITIL